jgi:hypothetical protein
MVVVAGLVVVSPAAARKFRIVGGSAEAHAVEDAELNPLESGGQNDKIHAEFSVSYRMVREPGLFKSPVLSVPGTRATRILIKGATTARGSGQTWLRDHYATWSCDFPPRKFKTVRDHSVVSGNTVQSQVGESFNFAASEKYCKGSEQGALPGGIGTSSGKHLAPHMLISHAFTAAELAARKRTVRLSPTATGPVDCSGGELAACVDTATASGKLKLRRK